MSNVLYKLKDNEWIIVGPNKKHKHGIKDNLANNKHVNVPEITKKYNERDNLKKILCKNMIMMGKCVYGNSCLYAHSLAEQNINPIRKTVYRIIHNERDLSKYDVASDNELYRALKIMTKVCDKCSEKKCTGGYNCKNGACNNDSVICVTDLNTGSCDGYCGNIHLTQRGFIPLKINDTHVQNVFAQKKLTLNPKNNDASNNVDELAFTKIFKFIQTNNNIDQTNVSIFNVKIEDV